MSAILGSVLLGEYPARHGVQERKAVARVLVLIKNTPRAYAWGSTDALPEMLGEQPTGEPQAELWLGDHAGAPAVVAKGGADTISLIDLIESDSETYGVDGGHLPFLMKVLAIGRPLSIQVHPDVEQARAGFAREEAAGVPLDDPTRSYTDENHKPEIIVALTPMQALCGFRPLTDVRADVAALEAAAHSPAKIALAVLRDRLQGGAAPSSDAAVRDEFLQWAFSDAPEVNAALAAVTEIVNRSTPTGGDEAAISPLRLQTLRLLAGSYPLDPGILVSLLIHVIHLEPGEALFLPPRRIHAYLSGVGVEVMASSDNVLRAGLTEKHVDVNELRAIVDLTESEPSPTLPTEARAGVTTWQPHVPDFSLRRVFLAPQGDFDDPPEGSADAVTLRSAYPSVMIVTKGVIRVERQDSGSREVARVRRGQSLYISAGSDVTLSGNGEAFIATVGQSWAGNSALQ